MLLQHTVRNRAESQPGAIALVFNDQRVTYHELEERSNQLARLLKAAGCQPGDRVCLLLPKSIPALVGMLGTLKAECIYVPMDTGSPAARLLKIIDACEPRCVLAMASTEHLLSQLLSDDRIRKTVHVGWMEPGRPVDAGFEVSFSWDDLSSVPSLAVESDGDPTDAAHILFTSGSTGVPKGVVITHANVIHFLNWATGYFGTNASDRISCHPPLHFDLSTFDVWGTFLAGAQLHLIPPEISLLPQKLADFIRRSELTQWFSVPSVMRYMAQFDVVQFNDFPSLKRLLWCGEALPTPTLMYWMKRLPRITFTNLYGPTETTIASSYYTVPACPDSEKAEIPIGTSCAGEEMIVFDESLQPVLVGEVGELYIRGVGLSPGYWKDPQKTNSVFLVDAEGRRMYKTGDLARVGEDGLVYLLGRADSQIKSRGYRIELGEIETALNASGLLRECAVVAVHTESFEGMTICCAYAPVSGLDLRPPDLREAVATVLPSYMLPSHWMSVESLPLNANGKSDRPRLREQFLAAMASA
jgi:amino acid adenylation domain-containing protein